MTTSPPPSMQDMEQRWSSLPRPTGERLSAERVRDWAGGPVLVAIDRQGTRQLLVAISDGRQVRLPAPLTGLELELRRLQPQGQADGAWLALAASSPDGQRPFAGLAADVVAELPDTGGDDPIAIFSIIERWRRFFGRQGNGLTREEQTGLIGELWFLLEWLPAVTLNAVSHWRGPLRGRHDWVSDSLSVEVKATSAGTGPVVHRIAGLDQLDEPGNGGLLLFSLRVVPDASGGESLDALLQRARREAASTGTVCSTMLDDRLRALGVTLADEGRYGEPVRISAGELYRIDDTFPRLTAGTFEDGLPPGVLDVRYNLDLAACGPWRVNCIPRDTSVLGDLA
jgi:hypothetical protein